jgi:hypothetical protein
MCSARPQSSVSAIAALVKYVPISCINQSTNSFFSQLLFTPSPPPPTVSTLSPSEQLSKNLQTLVGLQGALLPGYTAALAASVFVGPLRGLEKDFGRVGKLKNVKVLVIWVGLMSSFYVIVPNSWV